MISKQEVNRKILHILFSIVPISLYFIDSDITCKILVSIFSSIVIVFDIAILNKITKSGKIPNFFYRKSELDGNKKFSGSFWISITSLICVIFFKKQSYIIGMLAISFCDTFASIIGIKYGKHKILNTKKSIEGFCGFLLGIFPIYSILHLLNIDIGFFNLFFVILIAGISELVTIIDDNFSIMISSCIVVQLLF